MSCLFQFFTQTFSKMQFSKTSFGKAVRLLAVFSTLCLAFLTLMGLGSCNEGDPQLEYQTDFPDENGFYFNNEEERTSTFYTTFYAYYLISGSRQTLYIMREPLPPGRAFPTLNGMETILEMDLDPFINEMSGLMPGEYLYYTFENPPPSNQVNVLERFDSRFEQTSDGQMVLLNSGSLTVGVTEDGEYNITYDLRGTMEGYDVENHVETEYPCQFLGRFNGPVTLLD